MSNAKQDTVAVTFDSHDRYQGYSSAGKRYHYYAPKGLLKAGDKAVVDSPYGEALVTVHAVNPKNAWTGLTKWIICKVDRGAYERRKVLTEAIESATKRFEKEVDEALKQRRVEIACEINPNVKSLLQYIDALKLDLEAL